VAVNRPGSTRRFGVAAAAALGFTDATSNFSDVCAVATFAARSTAVNTRTTVFMATSSS
jgi:hypothetical protein